MIRWIKIILIGLPFYGMGVLAQKSPVPLDSTFMSLSIQEILDYKAYYQKELDALASEKRRLILKGIEDGERLLSSLSRSAYLDDILIRLADLYYLYEKDDYLQRMEEYEKKSGGEEPQLRFEKSLPLYQRILDEFPQGEFVDDALYNLGFLHEEMGEHEKANPLYRRLLAEYPKSVYAVEAGMRLGEYYFNMAQYDTAISYYEKVIENSKSPRYFEALYKLGWSHYQLNHFPEAISAFTELIEAGEAVEQPEKFSKLAPSVDLREEAMEYIAVAFVDFGGPSKAKAYLSKIGNPPWAKNVLFSLGKIYMEQREEYENAISAFTFLLEMNPLCDEAPQIQKRIAECYQRMKNDPLAFEARQRLFLSYKPGSLWWDAHPQEAVRLEAYRLTEEALRENFYALLSKSEKDPSLYQALVQLGRVYLETFPEEKNAVLIRWNLAWILDTKLHSYKEALSEYLTISMLYSSPVYEEFAEAKGFHIQDAAINAIVMADTLVQRERRQSSEKVAGIKEKEEEARFSTEGQKEIPFSEAEQWLLMAYDNYITRFPFDEKTQTILVNAGVLYYTHNRFADAVKYFKTLVKNFPQTVHKEVVQLSILESYLGNQDFSSAEVLAKELLTDTLAPSFRELVVTRLGEAIFRNAQALAMQNKTQQAGDEFFRMALEVPSASFADRALFNAGQAYEKMEDFQKAIRAYEAILASYPGSRFIPDALANLGFLYAKIGDLLKSAERYEQLAEIPGDSLRSKEALYNAFVYYSKAEAWQKAMDTGRRYAIRYTHTEDAPHVFLKSAEYALLLRDSLSAARLFGEFSLLFPHSPRGVEAFYRQGQVYLALDSCHLAENAFKMAYHAYQQGISKNPDLDPYMAGEALYESTRLFQKRFEQISLKQPIPVFQKALEEKQKLLQQLVNQYLELVELKTLRLPEALYRIGEVHEQWAQCWVAQERPLLDSSNRVVKEKEIRDQATVLYYKALQSYLDAHRFLGKMGNAKQTDSLTVLIEKWKTCSKSKISEILYSIGKINQESIDILLRAPIPPDLSGLALYEYQDQLLAKAIKPLVEIVLSAHEKHLLLADSLGFRTLWLDSARERLGEMGEFLGKRYTQLTQDVLEDFFIRWKNQESQLQNNKKIDQTQIDLFINLLELGQKYAQKSIWLQKEGMKKRTAWNLDIAPIHTSMKNFVFSLTDRLDSLSQWIGGKVKWASSLFESDPQYEELLGQMEDLAYAVEEFQKRFLEVAHEAWLDLPWMASESEEVALRLVRMDPDQYANTFGMSLKTFSVVTDTSWMYTPWNSLDQKNVQWDTLQWQSCWIRASDDTIFSKRGAFVISNGFRDSLYSSFRIRKLFSIPGIPIQGNLKWKTEQPCRIFLNGHFLGETDKKMDTCVTSFLLKGENALYVESTGNATFLNTGVLDVQFVQSVGKGGGPN